VVSAIDPESMLGIVGENAAMAEVARDAWARLEKASGKGKPLNRLDVQLTSSLF